MGQMCQLLPYNYDTGPVAKNKEFCLVLFVRRIVEVHLVVESILVLYILAQTAAPQQIVHWVNVVASLIPLEDSLLFCQALFVPGFC